MSTVLEIEQAIEQLKPAERAKLAAWLASKEGKDWDAQMDADSSSGKLDFLFKEAQQENSSGNLQDWPEKLTSFGGKTLNTLRCTLKN